MYKKFYSVQGRPPRRVICRFRNQRDTIRCYIIADQAHYGLPFWLLRGELSRTGSSKLPLLEHQSKCGDSVGTTASWRNSHQHSFCPSAYLEIVLDRVSRARTVREWNFPSRCIPQITSCQNHACYQRSGSHYTTHFSHFTHFFSTVC